MAESHVVSALAQKHARLLGELDYHLKMAEQIEAALSATAQSIKLFDPNYSIKNIKTIRRKHRSAYFQQGECGRLVLDVLRESGPLPTRAISAAVIEAKELDLSDAELSNVHQMVANVIKGLKRRGVVVRDGDAWSLNVIRR